ncbi:hypothetical protein B0O99DRAFT_621274 [Bisporella sp. PMI_857]|nr:hypothetical protein B0O99DRAFT_621274 [Bisporella sp. PMI_857]
MVLPETIQVVVVTTICFVLIALRTIYRLTRRCEVHAKCYRKWHVDDLWMALSFLPLLGRAFTIAWSNALADTQSLAHKSLAEQHSDKVLSSKLLIGGRIFYALFLWCMKMCLLELYLRISAGLQFYRNIGLAIRWSLYLTFVGIVLATTLECRPLHLAWNGDPAGAKCRKARANLFTMAITNIVTDIALILFPISLLRRSGLDFSRFIRLAILFALGSLVIITTLIRLPLILRDNAQKTRSLWASVEIACACVIANAPFFQAVIVDFKLGGSHNSAQQSGTFTRTTNTRAKTPRAGDGRDEDEIGLWHIEKRVSFLVEGRDNSVASGMSGPGPSMSEEDLQGPSHGNSNATVVALGPARSP